jgi:hypothetical protein
MKNHHYCYPQILQDGHYITIGPEWLAERKRLGWTERDYLTIQTGLYCGPLDWVRVASMAAREAKNEGML